MHRVTLILTFLLSLMFSSPSYSEWTRVSASVDGRIIKRDVLNETNTDNLNNIINAEPSNIRSIIAKKTTEAKKAKSSSKKTVKTKKVSKK